MSDFFGRLVPSLSGNTTTLPQAVAAARKRLHEYLKEAHTTQEAAAEFIDQLNEIDKEYRSLGDGAHDSKDPNTAKVRNGLLKTLRTAEKIFKKKSSEAMKNLAKKTQVGGFTESSVRSAGPSNQHQHKRHRPNHPQPASQRVAEPIWTKEQFAAYNAQTENPHLAQYDSQQDDNSSGRATMGHTNFVRLTSNSVDTFGNPIQDSQINPTASSTSHDGQSTESFSSSRPPSSNYAYYSRQIIIALTPCRLSPSEGSSSRQGSNRSRRSTESQDPSSFHNEGGQNNFGSPQQPSFAVHGQHYSSQPSRIQIPLSPYYNQAGPSGYPEYQHSSQYLHGQARFVPADQSEDEDHHDPGYSVPQTGPPPGQGRGYRGGYL